MALVVPNPSAMCPRGRAQEVYQLQGCTGDWDMASVPASGRTGSSATSYTRWHFPAGCALLLVFALVAFWDNLVSDVGQPSNSNPVMIVHGLLLLAWMILLVVQSLLPRLGRLDMHRKLGRYAFLVAPEVVASTIVLFITVWKGWEAVSPEVWPIAYCCHPTQAASSPPTARASAPSGTSASSIAERCCYPSRCLPGPSIPSLSRCCPRCRPARTCPSNMLT